jgi:hypothetical protein
MEHYLGIELKLADFKITPWLLWQNEWWKPVLNYEGLYEASSLGRIRSLDRIVGGKNNTTKKIKGRVLVQSVDGAGYLFVALCKNSISISKMVHRIVYISFYGYKELTIDHKKIGNKFNNRLSNLEYVTQRENSQRYFATKDFTSCISGVSFNKQIKKWQVFIRFLGKQYFLGRYNCESEAIIIQSAYFPLIINAETKEQVIAIIMPLRKRRSTPLSI